VCWKVVRRNTYGGTGGDPVAENRHIDRAHPDASEAGRTSEQIFLRGSMDIDPAAEGIPVSLFRALQPENACHDRITARGIGLEYLTGGHARPEDGTERLAHTDLHAD